MDTLDCKDIRVLLSGLVDDEVDAGTRHLAERHLVDCRSCRGVINEAESLDELIRMDVSSMINPRGLPEAFEGAVLGRTVYQREPKVYVQRWTTWTGWLAAAAAVALAVTIWVNDRRAGIVGDPSGAAGGASQVLPASYTTTDLYRSFTLDESELPATPGADEASLMSREDAESIYFAAVLLQMIDNGDGLESLTTIREAVEYDQLLPALMEAGPRLALNDHATVLAAEAVLTRLTSESVTENDLVEVRETIARHGLTGALDRISQKWDGRHTL